MLKGKESIMTKQEKRIKKFLLAQIVGALIGFGLVIRDAPPTNLVIYAAIISGLWIVASALMLKQIKAGFYLMCIQSIFIFIYNIGILRGDIFSTLVAVILLPVVNYYFVITKWKTKVENNATYEAVNINSSADDSVAYASQSVQADNSAQKNDHSKEDNFSGNNTSFFGSAKKMDITIDYYKELDIDRSWDEKTIREHLKNMEKIWIQRQGATNDKEQSLLIDKIIDNIRDARRYLIRAAKRQAYDQALELAYQAGRIVDVAEEKLQTILDQARAYYRKGNIKLAAKFAEEAVAGEVNNASAYDLLARCYFDMNTYDKALGVVDHGISIFKTDINLHWLGARIATIGTKNFENAQQRINRLLELAPNNSIGHSEQVYLHLRSGDEKLAFQEIDSYIAAHPDDNNFKRGVAYDLDTYSNTCYYYDAAQNATFIADKASYQKCLTLRTKAVEIFEDEHTQNQLESAKYYGKKAWNDWNMPAIKSLATYGTIFTVLGFIAEGFLPIGIALYLVMGVLIYFSFRPYWQINKSYVTGKAGKLEKVISIAGDGTARMAEYAFKALIQTMSLIFKFIIGLASGRWF